jgi:hypothetical protein
LITAALIVLSAVTLHGSSAQRQGSQKPPDSAGAAEAFVAKAIRGVWTAGGPSFVMDIRERTILFEFDMKEHPYHVDGTTIVIDFEDPTLGVQRKRVVRVTADVLVIEDERFKQRETLTRMRDDPPTGGARR